MTSILLCSYNRVTDILLKQDLVKLFVTIKLIVNSKNATVEVGYVIILLQY